MVFTGSKKVRISYRYDNFPNTMWKHISTYPYHFHNSSHNDVIDSFRFEKDIKEGFRGYMKYVRLKITRGLRGLED